MNLSLKLSRQLSRSGRLDISYIRSGIEETSGPSCHACHMTDAMEACSDMWRTWSLHKKYCKAVVQQERKHSNENIQLCIVCGVLRIAEFRLLSRKQIMIKRILAWILHTFSNRSQTILLLLQASHSCSSAMDICLLFGAVI